MRIQYLSVLCAGLLVASCSRQHPEQTANTTAPVANPTAPVQATAPAPAPPPVTARVVDESPAKSPDILIPANTRIRVRLGKSLGSKNSRAGERFTAYLDEPVVSGDKVVLPKGTLFHGHVTKSKQSGRLKGRAYLGVTLDSFRLHGATYAIITRADVRSSKSHKKRNQIAIGGGTGVGAAVGAVGGGGVGAIIGAGAGAAAGTAGAFITGRKNVTLPVETPLTFSLRTPVTIRG